MKPLALIVASALALVSLSSSAEPDFPSRRITLVVSAAPGGGLDGIARLLSKRMQEAWGQPAIVEDQGAAEGLVATQHVAKAPADGYTMLLTIPSLLLLKHNSNDLGFDPASSLAPVSELARTPSAISVNTKSGIESFQDLVAHCTHAPKPCVWGTGQQLSYLLGRRTFALSGVNDSINVPYKGTGPVVTDLLGNHIDVAITSIAAPLPYNHKGLRILAVNAEKRLAQAPDVPTFREVGLDVPARGSWYGLFVPRNTPPDVIAKVESLMRKVGSEAPAQELVRNLGAEPVFGSTHEFASVIRDDEAFLDGLVKQYPLK